MYELTLRPNVEAFLPKKENISALEDCLERYGNEYIRLLRVKDKLDFGDRLTPKSLMEIANEAVLDTKNLLDISEASPVYFSMLYLPRALRQGSYITLGIFAFGALAGLSGGLTAKDLETAGMVALFFGGGTIICSQRDYLYSAFDNSQKLIRIGDKKTVPVAGTIAHEYTHHLQGDLTKLLAKGKNPIAEGHARGVQRIISEAFAERYDNPAYIYDTIEATAMELKACYTYICNKNSIAPKRSLERFAIPRLRRIISKYCGHHYNIGVSAMCIAELKHGKQIYKDVLNNDYAFLRN